MPELSTTCIVGLSIVSPLAWIVTAVLLGIVVGAWVIAAVVAFTVLKRAMEVTRHVEHAHEADDARRRALRHSA